MNRLRGILTALISISLILSGPLAAGAQQKKRATSVEGAPVKGIATSGAAMPEPDSGEVIEQPSEMRAVIERFVTDRAAVNRSAGSPLSPQNAPRLRKFYGDWLTGIGRMNFEAMSEAGRVDYVLLRNFLEHELREVEINAKRFAEMEPLTPFAKELLSFEDRRRDMQPENGRQAAEALTRLNKQLTDLRRAAEAALRPPGRGPAQQGEGQESKTDPALRELLGKKAVVNRAVNALAATRQALRNWNNFYSGYDPLFTWWVEQPYREMDRSLDSYATFLRERVLGMRSDLPVPGVGGPGGGFGGGQAGAGAQAAAQRAGAAGQPVRQEDIPIIGDPIGRDALMSELQFEMIPYTPEELIALAKKEMAWCEAEMKRAAREMGFGEDWRAALEKVKTLHVEPGEQPKLIRELAQEAIDYVEKNNLLTVPPLAKELWRMEMLTPERQLVSPFFLGGEVIQVSFPTSGMTHEQKMMSMRGNNIHFSRATVHHELIPGHHLQGFMTSRYRTYRSVFSTPFWTEGWSLYWELFLWDRGFARSPENRVGMLFWRMHRCARIIFSLSFHLGQMTPEECVELLVKQVGHERDNATAEVRRSFGGQYGPLYQAAYLLGGLQFYSLQKDLVGSGKMSNRQFHDAILKENRLPVEMVRAILTRQPLKRDFKTQWKFYGAIPAQ
jgi:hypothetical protein